MNKKSIFAIVVAIIAAVVVVNFGRIGEDVKNEQIVVNQFPFSGEMEYWTTPGFKWQWFGKTTHYYKTNQLWFGSDNEEGKQMGNPIPVIFNDASDGQIYGSLRVKLPTDPTYLARIQTDYNGMDRLMQDLVRPTVTKVIYASGPLMSAFESYAEKKNDLIEYITDQLNNGVYKTTVKTVETVDPITNEKKTLKIASLISALSEELEADQLHKKENVDQISEAGSSLAEHMQRLDEALQKMQSAVEMFTDDLSYAQSKDFEEM